MGYFNELPNIEINNRTKNELSNDEVTIVKNLFKRAKIRDDVVSVVSAFDYYSITGNERPEQIAEKFYEDAELDWVILITNNIIDLNSQWPLDENSLGKFLEDKYGDQAYTGIHHYETIAVYDSYKRLVLPGNLIVDESFYKAPEYQTITSVPPGITFPAITSAGIGASLLPLVGTGGTIVGAYIENSGQGYNTTPTVYLSAPPATSDATSECVINNYYVTTIVNLDGGVGYNEAPNITFSSPPTSVSAAASCVIDESGQVTSIVDLESGVGYGLTSPTIQFSFPPIVFASGTYVSIGGTTIGSSVEGAYVKSDGSKVYSSSLFGSTLINEYDLSTPWNVTTLSFANGLDVSTNFSYTTGIDFSADGQYMFVCGGLSGVYSLVKYTLSTNWDISTATVSQSLPIPEPGAVRLKSDGTVVYILNISGADTVHQYNLSTAWDLSSIGASSGNLNITGLSGEDEVAGFTFFEDGSKLFAVGSTLQSVLEFDLSTPWDLSSGSYIANYYIGDKITDPVDVYVKSDRKEVLVAGSIGGNPDKLFQYRLDSVAEASSTVTNSGVSTVTVTNSGIGYTVSPTITFSSPYPAVTATGESFINVSGIVTSITITNAGFGYTVAPTITIDAAPISKTASFTVQMNSNTGISSIVVTNGGSNYVNSPYFRIVSEPDDIVNVEIGDLHLQNNKTWKWNGTDWQEKITEELQYFDPGSSSIIRVSGSASSFPVTNYDYESKLNDEKRKILLLRPEYLPLVIDDLRNIMKYDPQSKYYVSDTLKSTYNPALSGV